LLQIAAKPAKASRIDRPARPRAAKNVASAGLISRKPKRTMTTETSTATSENTASRRAQAASGDTGSSE